MKSKLEYIWLDGYKPTQSLRSKTRVETDFGGTLEECPMWSFDGSSTLQASGDDSDCLLKPVAARCSTSRVLSSAGARAASRTEPTIVGAFSVRRSSSSASLAFTWQRMACRGHLVCVCVFA